MPRLSQLATFAPAVSLAKFLRGHCTKERAFKGFAEFFKPAGRETLARGLEMSGGVRSRLLPDDICKLHLFSRLHNAFSLISDRFADETAKRVALGYTLLVCWVVDEPNRSSGLLTPRHGLTDVGKLWLLGLFGFNPEIETFLSEFTPVMNADGCIVFEAPVAEVVQPQPSAVAAKITRTELPTDQPSEPAPTGQSVVETDAQSITPAEVVPTEKPKKKNKGIVYRNPNTGKAMSKADWEALQREDSRCA